MAAVRNDRGKYSNINNLCSLFWQTRGEARIGTSFLAVQGYWKQSLGQEGSMCTLWASSGRCNFGQGEKKLHKQMEYGPGMNTALMNVDQEKSGLEKNSFFFVMCSIWEQWFSSGEMHLHITSPLFLYSKPRRHKISLSCEPRKRSDSYIKEQRQSNLSVVCSTKRRSCDESCNLEQGFFRGHDILAC